MAPAAALPVMAALLFARTGRGHAHAHRLARALGVESLSAVGCPQRQIWTRSLARALGVESLSAVGCPQRQIWTRRCAPDGRDLARDLARDLSHDLAHDLARGRSSLPQMTVVVAAAAAADAA